LQPLKQGKMNTKLYVGNLAPGETDKSIHDIFAAHGPVSDVYLVKNRITARSRRFAFVTMDTAASAERAMQLLDGTMAGGRFLNVIAADDRPTRGSFAARAPQRSFRKLY
jgi:RNA recognition motif-containing protein